jgi:hypothetical protein
MRSPRLARRIVLPVLAVLLTVAAPGSPRAARSRAARAPAAASPAPARTATLAGTVGASNAAARTFDLVTGVGYALRVIRIHAPAPSGARGAVLPLPARGSIVRVECAHTAAGYEATRIEMVAPAPARMP